MNDMTAAERVAAIRERVRAALAPYEMRAESELPGIIRELDEEMGSPDEPDDPKSMRKSVAMSAVATLVTDLVFYCNEEGIPLTQVMNAGYAAGTEAWQRAANELMFGVRE